MYHQSCSHIERNNAHRADALYMPEAHAVGEEDRRRDECVLYPSPIKSVKLALVLRPNGTAVLRDTIS